MAWPELNVISSHFLCILTTKSMCNSSTAIYVLMYELAAAVAAASVSSCGDPCSSFYMFLITVIAFANKFKAFNQRSESYVL